MKAIEALRRTYRQVAAERVGLPRRAGGYDQIVLVGQFTTPEQILEIMRAHPDTSQQFPLQDPVTGELYWDWAEDPPGSRPIPPSPGGP